MTLLKCELLFGISDPHSAMVSLMTKYLNDLIAGQHLL